MTRGIAGTLDGLDDPAIPHEIPRVFTVVSDPIGARIVESFDHTGRNNVAGTFNRVGVAEVFGIEILANSDPLF